MESGVWGTISIFPLLASAKIWITAAVKTKALTGFYLCLCLYLFVFVSIHFFTCSLIGHLQGVFIIMGRTIIFPLLASEKIWITTAVKTTVLTGFLQTISLFTVSAAATIQPGSPTHLHLEVTFKSGGDPAKYNMDYRHSKNYSLDWLCAEIDSVHQQ